MRAASNSASPLAPIRNVPDKVRFPVLQFEPKDTGGVRHFDVKVVVVVVVLVDDTDAEGLGVAEFAVVDSRDKNVLDLARVSGLQVGVDA